MKNLNPGDKLCKYQPYVDQFDICCLGEAVTHTVHIHNQEELSRMFNLMKRVVRTRREVRFTVTTASKKKSLKKLVA